MLVCTFGNSDDSGSKDRLAEFADFYSWAASPKPWRSPAMEFIRQRTPERVGVTQIGHSVMGSGPSRNCPVVCVHTPRKHRCNAQSA